MMQGNTYTDNHDYDRAIAAVSEAIRLDPKSAGAFISRGVAWEKRRHDQAIADFSEAIRLEPDSASPHTTEAVLRD